MLQTVGVILFFIASPQEDARALVEQLRSDSVVERDTAAKKLLSLGDPAREALEKAARDPDAEVASRAVRILRVLAIRSQVPPRLKAAVPGIEDRLAADHDRAWTEAFFAVLGDRNAQRPPPGIERADLEFLVARALRGASEENERSALCQIAGGNHLRAAVPELIRLLSDPSVKVQHVARRGLIELDAREAAPELLKLMAGESKTLSLHALRLLSELEAREAVPGLVELLRSDREHARANAAAALEALGSKDEAPALRPLLQDSSAVVCRAAARALGVLGSSESVPDLLALLRERERDVHSGAAFALGKLRAKEAVPELIKILESPGRFDSRDAIALALGELEAKESLPHLLRLLEDKDFQGQVEVLSVVARLGGAAASPQIIACFKHEDSEVRSAAVAAARSLKVKGLAPALAVLLEDTSDDVLQATAEAIVESGAAEAAAPLQALAANENAREICRRWATLVLGRGAVRAAVPFLRERLRDANLPAGLGVCSIHALADLGAKEAIEDLRKLLGSKDEEVKGAAVTALGRLGAVEAVPELRKLLADPAGPYVARLAAVSALAALGDRESATVLRKLVDDEFPGIAALALAELGDRESVPVILKVLESGDGEERRCAVDALARLDPAAAAARLKERLKDPRWEVRSAAAEGLCRLGLREGIPVLLGEARSNTRLSLASLNAVRSPGRWRTLRERKTAWVMPGGTVDSRRLLRLAAGVEVDVPEDATSMWIFGGDLEQGWRPSLYVIEEYERSAILEGDRVRTLPRHREIRFWEAWWKEESRR